MNDIKIARKLCSINASAKSRSIHFDLSFNKVKQLLVRKTCYYTGVRFDDANIRSFDRVDNSRGYVDDNVVVCTKEFNELKRDITMKQIKTLYFKTFKHQGKL